MPDILERLDRYAALKPGDAHPAWLPVNGWGPVVNADMAAAAAEIRELRAKVMLVQNMAGFKEIKPNG